MPEDNFILTGRSIQVEELVQKKLDTCKQVLFPKSFVRPSRIQSAAAANREMPRVHNSFFPPGITKIKKKDDHRPDV